jgi:anaerobic C4-dicarboxylate transporter
MTKRKRTSNELQDTTQKKTKERNMNPRVHLHFFLVAIVLSVLLRYTDSDYPFSIFKLFLCKNMSNTKQIVILHTGTLMIGGQVIIRTLLIGFH